jgi:hypothetical protein
MRPNRMALAAASLLVFASSAHAQREDRTRPTGSSRSYGRAPEVEVWIDRYVFRSGERIRAYFESEAGAYVTILRVSTLGNVTVLYPRRPTAQRVYRERLSNDEVPYGGRPEFYLNEPEGVGFVFAVASFEPFDYRAFNSGGQWSMTRLAGYGYGDPYRAINSFVSRTLSTRADYSSDYIQYEVLSDGRYQRYGSVYGSPASWYNDRYFRCLDFYGLQTVGYCHSYAGSGIGGFPYIVFRPPQSPTPTTPTTPRRPKMAPPGRIIPDPGVAAEAASSGDASSSRYSGARERSSSPRVIDNGENLRSQPRQRTESQPRQRTESQPRQRPEPARYEPEPQVIAQPRHEPARVERYEPRSTPRYEPPSTPRYEPPSTPRYEPPTPARVEPPRVEQRQEPRPQPVAREHPAPRVDPVPPPPPPPAP